MKKENQITNLEISKRLKDLEFDYPTLWVWIKRDLDWCLECSEYLKNKDNILEKISAFTVAELGYILPIYIETIDRFYLYENITGVDSALIYTIEYKSLDNKCLFKVSSQINEANARAEMLIKLIENRWY